LHLDIEDTYRRFFPTIREKCARMLNDPIEGQDLAQETFVRLLRAGPASTDIRQVTAWIYRTCTRLAIDRMRRRRMQAEPAGEDRLSPADGAPDLEGAVASRQQWLRLARMVPTRELELALLARVDGLTHDEISEVTGVATRTVRRLLARFDARLGRLREQGRFDERS
jgi:RNA polymerase sigma-70 factor (ECF subfamily)